MSERRQDDEKTLTPTPLPSQWERGSWRLCQGRHPVTLVALLGLALVLTGCAAGSPAVVAPQAPVEAPVLVAAAVEEAEAPDAMARVSPPTVVPIEQSASTDPAPLAASAPETGANTSTETAAFAREAPAVTAPLAEAASAVDEMAEAAPAPALQTAATRLPPPPDPGTGQSLIVEGGSNGRLEVALTFDAGADTGYAAGILDLLRDEGLLATFGMTGVWAQANPDLVQRMVAEGHQVINHTWDHASLTGANTGLPAQSPEQIATQLADTEALVSDITGGYEMRPYFRPPYGDYDAASLEYLYNNGYYLSIWWTCDTHGWAGWGAQEIIDYCTTNIVEDEILLLHVGADAVTDFEALPGLIQFFRDSGYAFVTVEQMLQP